MDALIPFDYATLRVVWWVLLGALLIGFAVMDGFDLGVAALLPLVAKTDVERRVVINVVGPVWEGNQVWLITAGGAIFAAWPLLYAASFSGFYLAMMLALIALILRPVGFKYRSKMEGTRWRNTWDGVLCFSGVVASLVFGVAVGNIILGVPFTFDKPRCAWSTRAISTSCSRLSRCWPACSAWPCWPCTARCCWPGAPRAWWPAAPATGAGCARC